jgi:LysM repeat protein
MQPQSIRPAIGTVKFLFVLALTATVLAGCSSSWNPLSRWGKKEQPAVVVDTQPEPPDGAAVGDQRTAMEVAADAGAAAQAAPVTSAAAPVSLAPNAPESYVVRRGDTLWDISRTFLRDPWFWPEIWQVNPQIENPHLIYPGDVLRLVYVDGQPRVTLERGGAARVSPRVRSVPLEAAVTSIPYEIVAAFMSKPSVLSKEQIKAAPYILASHDRHVIMAEGNTVYARGFSATPENGARYSVIRIGDALRDPDDNEVVGYNGEYTASGRVTRGGDPVTLILTESSRETLEGDRLFSGNVDVPLDFIPSSPRTKIDGEIIAVHDGVSMIGQYQVVAINRGARHGLAPGNVLGVFEAGAKVRDRFEHGKLAGAGILFAKNVRLPDERSGTFMVFRAFDRISFGLIMEAKNTIKVTDRVGNP